MRRSPAAARVGRLAAASGLSCFHFEHRVHLPLPASWVPGIDPTLADPPSWEDGILPEAKYQSFRHDLALGSFHPHHRAKWSTHELTHGLVGFAWRKDATPLFHATAGRLAELVPVALWYFFDEACLRRCPDHAGQGALFRTLCPACEAVAGPDPKDERAEEHLAAGMRFVERELEAVDRTLSTGRPVPHKWATLDLTSDGIAYARAHGERLASPEFASYMERFAVRDGGWCDDLDALRARMSAVLDGLLGRSEPAPLAPSAAHGALRWVLQDLGWRLHQITADTNGDATAQLDRICRGLAEAVPGTTEASTEVRYRPVHEARSAYTELCGRFELPHPDDVFALGYPVPGLTGCALPLVEGLRSCMPLTTDVLESALEPMVQPFLTTDLSRRHLADRFATWLEHHQPGPLAELARWEALVITAPRRAPEHLRGPAAREASWQLAAGVGVARFESDVLQLAERVDQGSIVALRRGDKAELEPLDERELPQGPSALLVGRDEDGELLVLDIDPDTASVLVAGPFEADRLPPEELEALTELGVVHPTSWSIAWVGPTGGID